MDRRLRLFGAGLVQNQFMMCKVFMGLPHFTEGLSKSFSIVALLYDCLKKGCF